MLLLMLECALRKGTHLLVQEIPARFEFEFLQFSFSPGEYVLTDLASFYLGGLYL